jgi:6-phosphogluconolactonase (cycloisomerase 2 family)
LSRVYVSSWSGGPASEPASGQDGIALFERDAATGALLPSAVHAPVRGATFLALHPSGDWLYADCELEPPGGSGGSGGVAAFRVERDGCLVPLGAAPTGGTGTCHVAVHPSGRYLLSADYGSGHVAVHRIAGDGSIAQRCDLVVSDRCGPDPRRQASSHAHFCWPEPGGRYVLVLDLGTDELRTYTLDAATGRLAEIATCSAGPAAGPRHLVAHPDGYLLATGELDSTLITFSYDPASGEARRTSSVPASRLVTRRGENAPSELALGGGGRFCYVANRGADSVGVFALEGGTPRMVAEVSCGGHWPRHLAVIGGYLYVANQESSAVAVFALDEATGVPHPAGVTEVQRPFCVLAAG